jgi:hypothetical protein
MSVEPVNRWNTRQQLHLSLDLPMGTDMETRLCPDEIGVQDGTTGPT